MDMEGAIYPRHTSRLVRLFRLCSVCGLISKLVWSNIKTCVGSRSFLEACEKQKSILHNHTIMTRYADIYSKILSIH